MQNMRKLSQQTLIGVLRDACHVWRQRERWSLESLSNAMVEHYYQCGFDVVWRVEFKQPGPGRDLGRVMKANSERVFRWLDDQTKSNVLLPANLVPMVLWALPMDLRLQAASKLLAPVGLEVAIAHTPESESSFGSVMANMAKEAGEGIAAFARLAERATPEALQCAHVEIHEAIEALRDALDHVNELVRPTAVG